jgi:protein-disulfide isomerase/uncharacterized membrane protein
MRTDNTYLKLILALALVGILVSGWLLSIHIKFSTGQAGLTESCTIPLIGSSQGCANIAVSDYSVVAGVPLAAIAMSFYFTVLILVFWAMRNYQMAYEALYVSYFLSTVSILVTVVMFSISRFVLKSFCIGCSMLWLVNLALWPCFVKHLSLSWGGALAANLELLRQRALKLKKERIGLSFALGAVCLLVFSVIGASAKGLSNESPGDSSALITEYQNAPQVFLPIEAIGGPSSKGAEAPVMDIVEFADFQCPGCRMGSQFLRPFLMKHGDKVRLTFRNFPLDGSCNSFVPNGGHTMACSSARHAICAGQQGKFWEMHDMIFDNQESLSVAMLGELVVKTGLDQAKLEACLKDSSTESILQKDIQWGDLIQLESTPTMIVNGRKLVGAHSPADLEALLQVLEKERNK